MKILLIAYACEPNKGSEPGVGWNWVVNLSRFVDVTVLTRKNNRESIENQLGNLLDSDIKFIYFDILYFSKIKKIIPFGVQLYYLLWEFFAVNKVKEIKFDLVQRLTFVSMVTLLRLYKLNTPYIFSFCAGGEKAPVSILRNYSLKYRLKEYLRDIYNSFYLFSPVTRRILGESKLIIAVTKDTEKRISKFNLSNKIITMPAIGLERTEANRSPSPKGRILYAGSVIYLKNVDILVRSISGIKSDIILDIFGEGKELLKVRNIAVGLNIENKVNFCGKIERNKLMEVLQDYDLAVHASSHDSGSMFLLEAVSKGIPVLFLATGGPEEIFSGIDYPLKVNPDQRYDEIVREFSEKVDWFYENHESFFQSFFLTREKIIERFDWENKAKRMINFYKEILSENPSST